MGASAQTQPASSTVPAPFGGTCFWVYTGFSKEPMYIVEHFLRGTGRQAEQQFIIQKL